ncbi:MAG TPA: M23 family metallopeptidase [Desulfosporosinus sp.]|nr:M23 family metallopeptidase [Desulfosporosinus sp.]
MKNKYTIIFIPPDHSNTHQFQFSKQGRRVLGGGMLLIGAMMIGLFAQNLYLSHYIKERQPTMDHIDQLKSTIVERDQEVSHLNEMSNQITNDLKTIKDLEEKLPSILKINPTSSSATLSRGIDPTAQNFVSSNPTIQTLDHQAPIVAEHLNLLQRYYEVAVLQKDQLEHTPTIIPAEGEITSFFGYRRNPFGGRSTEYHNGIDIACNYGSPVSASAAGVVTFAELDPILGLKVVINHGHGIVTFYGHNSRLLVKKGDQVKKSDLIAYSGNSGRSTGSHLHYGAIVNGENVDPLTFTNFTKEEQPDV